MRKGGFYDEANMGRYGHTPVTDDSKTGLTFIGFEVWEEADLTYTSHDERAGNSEAISITGALAGNRVVGKITDLEVTAGMVMAYYAQDQMPD